MNIDISRIRAFTSAAVTSNNVKAAVVGAGLSFAGGQMWYNASKGRSVVGDDLASIGVVAGGAATALLGAFALHNTRAAMKIGTIAVGGVSLLAFATPTALAMQKPPVDPNHPGSPMAPNGEAPSTDKDKIEGLDKVPGVVTDDPGAADPPTTDPPATDTPAGDPKATEPAATDPPAADTPAEDPKATEPATTDPATVDPKAGEPATAEVPADPATVDPKAGEPATAEVPADPATVDPKAGEPATAEVPADPAPAEPKASEPKHGKSTHGAKKAKPAKPAEVTRAQPKSPPESHTPSPIEKGLHDIGSLIFPSQKKPQKGIDAPVRIGSAAADPSGEPSTIFEGAARRLGQLFGFGG